MDCCWPSAASTSSVIYPLVGRGPIPRSELQQVQRLREADVRTLHLLQLRAQRVLVSQGGASAMAKWLVPKVIPLVLRSPLMPRIQRRVFFGAPLPPLDPAFGFQGSVRGVEAGG